MKKKICNLKEGDIFIHRGIVYEVWHKNKWDTEVRSIDNVFDSYSYKFNKVTKHASYLYCKFSNYTVVDI